MKKLYLTICALLFSSVATMTWGQLSYISNFYGPGYYRIFNGQSGKNLDVVSNKGDLNMSAINMAENTHALHSDAGSIVHMDFLDEASLEIATPYGLYNIGAQGAGTQVITSQMMGLFNQYLGSLGIAYPLDFIPVNINPARTEGETTAIQRSLLGSLYQASFNMLGMTALFRDNHGVHQPLIGSNFGFAMDATYASNSFQQLAAQYFPGYDQYCNWYLAPTDGNDNYYTPPYNNDDENGYITDGTTNWATVYVDFPFVLPDGATAYIVDDYGEAVPLDWQFVPDNVPVLLSWPGNGTNDVKLRPGILSLEQLNALNATLQSRLAPWYNGSNETIYNMITTPSTYPDAVSAFGQDVIDYVYAFGANMMDEVGVSVEQKAQLLQLPKDQFFEAVCQAVEQMLLAESALPADATDEQSRQVGRAAMMAANIRQIIVNGIRNKFFYDNYMEVFSDAMQQSNELADAYRATARGNSLFWCGDFFAYSDKSSLEGQNAPVDGYKKLSSVVDGKPVFDAPVTEWNGNMAYLDQSSHSLQWIVNNGNPGDIYKVIDKLQVAYAYWYGDNDNTVHLFAKDNDNCLPSKRSVKSQGAIDYMQNLYFNTFGRTKRSHETFTDQSNWVEILMPYDSLQAASPSLAVLAGEYYNNTPINFLNGQFTVSGLNGRLVSLDNPVIEMNGMPSVEEKVSINSDINTFTAANFFEEEEQNGCFFIKPKQQEVAYLAWSVWNGQAFVVPAQTEESVNEHGLKGGVGVNLELTEGDAKFESGTSYECYGVIRKKTSNANLSKRRAGQFDDNVNEPISGEFEFWPFYIADTEAIITGVNTVSADRQAAGVDYVNLAGQRSSRPWQGVNIVVTRYTDGTCRSAKAIY
jgi:hypothetical protein